MQKIQETALAAAQEAVGTTGDEKDADNGGTALTSAQEEQAKIIGDTVLEPTAAGETVNETAANGSDNSRHDDIVCNPATILQYECIWWFIREPAADTLV